MATVDRSAVRLFAWSKSLRRARTQRGMSQGELARRSGISKRTIAGLESFAARDGDTDCHFPHFATLHALALALDMDTATLFRGSRTQYDGDKP